MPSRRRPTRKKKKTTTTEPAPAPARRRRPRRHGKKKPAPGGAGRRGLGAAATIAKKRLGIRRLRPEQEKALGSILAGHDTLAVLPTGYGKSLLYQVPALLADRPTVVISPLIALMADQEQALLRRNVAVVRIDSTLRVAARRQALERLEQGGSLIVLTTPESLESPEVLKRLAEVRPSLLCIDEAHCISEWGHDFRPAYLRLGAQRKPLGNPPVLALTATATPHVREDIQERLHMNDARVVAASPHRSNLRLEVQLVHAGDKPQRAGRLLRRLPRPGIVYCSTTLEVDSIHTALTRGRLPTDRYHGRMSKSERDESQERFMRASKRRVMVATSAFGMGIDKPDIRYVLHYQTPGSIEQYVQEAGRAGRDGKPSRCILLYDEADLAIQRHLLRRSRANPAQLRRVAEALRAWAADGRAVSSSELGLSAGVPQAVAGTACARLEELGVVERESRKYRSTVTAAELERRARGLARRVEIQRRQDELRLEALHDYAHSIECRSVVLRRYFGEERPPRCGNCDNCASAPRRKESAVQDPRTKKRRKRKRKAGPAKQRPG